MKTYKTPILSSIFNAIGVLILIGAVLWFIVGIVLAGEARSSLPLLPAIGVVLLLVLGALIYFGIAEAIDYLGRTAHATQRLCMLAETSQHTTAAQIETSIERLCNIIETSVVSKIQNIEQKLDASLLTALSSVVRKIQSIEQRLLSSTPFLVQLDKASVSAQPSAAPKSVTYYYSTDGTQQGPCTAGELNELRSKGVIDEKTSVFRKGDSEWRKFRDFPELTGA